MVYMNNAATGYPKFPSALKAMTESLEIGALSANRDSVITESVCSRMFDLRNRIGDMLHATEPHEIVFTPSDTIALNTLMQGIGLGDGDVLLIDSVGHNAVSRPAMYLAKSRGVVLVSVGSLRELGEALSEHGDKVKAAVFSHGSNVTGDAIDINTIGRVLDSHKIPFILDVAQTIGLYPIDVEAAHVSAAAFAGHKGLNGPQGTGGFYIRKSFKVDPILFGGNGADSMSLNPDIVYPDSFEVGTPAMHDLIGLHQSLLEIEAIGADAYAENIRAIAQFAHDELIKIPNVIVYGRNKKDLPVVSFNVYGKTCKDVGMILSQKGGIICRTGVHCASLAMHKLDVMDDFGGTVRVSFGWKSTKEEVNILVECVKEIAKNA